MENNTNLSLKSLSSDEINRIEEFRKSKHTAVLAILFSDIVNSTYATEKLGEQTYSKLRHIHDELFKKIMCRDNAGMIIKEIGDSFLCVFAEPSTAVLRAIEFQRAIYANKKNLTVKDFTLTVKIGIHAGQVVVENSLALDIFGRHVNRASRIQAIANGGQILTSQSIWENAVGLLKDNDGDKIGWISYGKTKLKGIDERVDIFGFYPKEIGKPITPKIFRTQKQKRIGLVFSIILLLVLFSVYILKRFEQIKSQSPTQIQAAKKSYYVQFDFSDLTLQEKADFGKVMTDTLAIEEAILTQIVPILSPDSVVTESDLIKSFSNNGKLYIRHANHTESDERYFKDTLKFSGAFFFKGVAQVKNQDTIRLDLSYHWWTETVSSWMKERFISRTKELREKFRNHFQDAIVSQRNNAVQGIILDVDDNTVLFKMTKDAILRTGASISFCSFYSNKEGLNLWLNDHKQKMDYLKDKPQFADELKEEIKYYEEDKDELTKDLMAGKGSECHGMGIYGKVTELYDSTGKATWLNKSIFPFAKPKKGDRIHLEYN